MPHGFGPGFTGCCERALKSTEMTYNAIAHSRTEESLLTIAKGVSAATGEMFFRSLVETLPEL
jgi:hypothetical protein